MTTGIVCCMPGDTAQIAANLMKQHGVGAVLVVSELSDPLLEGIITDRDLCCGVVAGAKDANTIQVFELMTRVPVTCLPEDSLEDCEQRMQENQVRRIPVVNDSGRCIGIVTQADLALHLPAARVGETVREISKPSAPGMRLHFEKDHFYCGLLHEEEQIVLLNCRRDMRREAEVVQ
jgi:CBS domain-containing protein